MTQTELSRFVDDLDDPAQIIARIQRRAADALDD